MNICANEDLKKTLLPGRKQQTATTIYVLSFKSRIQFNIMKEWDVATKSYLTRDDYI